MISRVWTKSQRTSEQASVDEIPGNKRTSVLQASWEGGAVDGGSMNAFLATALTRAMRAAVPIPAVASASVLRYAVVGGSVVGVVRPL